jgi:hypothetical protein
LHDGVSCDVEQYCVMWLLNHYREDCREDWRTSQRFRTPCTGLDYNLLRLKGLAGIIFGQPPRSTIIHCRPGQGNDNLGLEYSKKINCAWIYSRFSKQNAV